MNRHSIKEIESWLSSNGVYYVAWPSKENLRGFNVLLGDAMRSLSEPVGIFLLPEKFKTTAVSELTDDIATEYDFFLGSVNIFLVDHPSLREGLLPNTSWIVLKKRKFFVNILPEDHNSDPILPITYFKDLFKKHLPLSRLNPYSTSSSTGNRMFYGRADLISSVLDFDGKTPNHVVFGPKRSGKTSVANMLDESIFLQKRTSRERSTDKTTRTRHQTNVLSYDLRGIGASGYGNFWKLLGRKYFSQRALQRDSSLPWPALKAMIRRDGVVEVDSEMIGYSKFINFLTEPGTRFLLLLDEVDSFLEMDKGLGWPILESLVKLTDEKTSRIKLVLLGYEKLYEYSRTIGFPMYEKCTKTRLTNLVFEEVRELVLEPMEEMGITITHPFDDVVTPIFRETGGMPYMVQRTCHLLVNHMSKKGKRELSPGLVKSFLLSEGAELTQGRIDSFGQLESPLERLVSQVASTFKQDAIKLKDVGYVLENMSFPIKVARLTECAHYLYMHNIFEAPATVDGVVHFASDHLKASLSKQVGKSPMKSKTVAETLGEVREYEGK